MNELFEIAHSLSPTEAALVRNRLESEGIPARLNGEATGNALWHMGPGIAGVSVMVSHDDADRAQQILAATESIQDEAHDDFGDAHFTGDDESDEGIYYDDEADEEEDHDDLPSEISPEIIRAWRAAVIGAFFFPPLLTLYSMWVLFHLEKEPGGEGEQNWRLTAAYAINIVVLVVVAGVVLSFAVM